MLVLTRKVNESIVIGDNVTVTVVEIHGNRVRLGIQAPTEVPVHRSEVYAAVNTGGANPPPPPDMVSVVPKGKRRKRFRRQR